MRYKSGGPGFLGRLGGRRKTAAYIGGSVLALVLFYVGLAVVGGLIGQPRPPPKGTPGASAASERPAIKKRVITEVRQIPYREQAVESHSLPKNVREVRSRGAEGMASRTYEVTLTNGVQSGKRLLREVVISAPVPEIVAVGASGERHCDPHYAIACVPIASDVDCVGGDEDGPVYVEGPVKVIGEDIYNLDRDGDGYACV
jgi:hypothetical protein